MYLATEPEVLDHRGPVSLTLDAASSQAPVARSVAETLAILYGFGLDEVADVKLAVDEACAQLERSVADIPSITMEMEVRRFVMSVSVSAELPDGTEVRETGFGWHVLHTLTDNAQVRVDESEPHNTARRWSITFTKSSGVTE
ncbi:ATP-binding protein [Tomitella fengzijianii]|uniref:ATP-binding protein n=1 Tax=Tomitella fengzijianii TaxID=2597660 RepID=A0A516X2S6_9ACTN|nr:ATP-binding protein [Tomitella fengzijianii]QDQ97347.1 ATP-binding protein [Tomitella fengzijianii]